MREYQSINSLTKFEGCPRCYWLSYVAGLADEQTSPAQALGKEVHDAIKNYHLKQPKAELSEEAEKLVKVYVENVPVSRLEIAEQEFLVPFENIATGEILSQKEMKFKGIFDGLNLKDGWIYEHKTASNYWVYADVATNIQATGYAYAYFKLYGKLPEGIGFSILKKNKIACKYQPLETYRTYEDLVYFFHWVKRIVGEIEISDFAPKQTRFNNHHRMCPYSGGKE